MGFLHSETMIFHVSKPTSIQAVRLIEIKRRIAKKLASERYATKDVDHQDMIFSFISHGLTETDLVADAVVQILAGPENTATALRATLLHTISNPRIYRSLHDEIDQAGP